MEIVPLPDHIYEITNAYLHLWVDSEVKLMYTDWLVAPTSLQYREAAVLFIRTIQEYAVEYWIMDSTRLQGFSLEEQKQVIQQVAPAVAASALKKVARIIAQDVENRVMFAETVHALKNKYQAFVEIKQFYSYNDAAHWLTVIRA